MPRKIIAFSWSRRTAMVSPPNTPLTRASNELWAVAGMHRHTNTSSVRKAARTGVSSSEPREPFNAFEDSHS